MQARRWVLKFTRWYNVDHKHSGLKFVTPHQRHSGVADEVLERRKHVYRNAKACHPQRWSDIRNWDLPDRVWLNPEKNLTQLEQAA